MALNTSNPIQHFAHWTLRPAYVSSGLSPERKNQVFQGDFFKVNQEFSDSPKSTRLSSDLRLLVRNIHHQIGDESKFNQHMVDYEAPCAAGFIDDDRIATLGRSGYVKVVEIKNGKPLFGMKINDEFDHYLYNPTSKCFLAYDYDFNSGEKIKLLEIYVFDKNLDLQYIGEINLPNPPQELRKVTFHADIEKLEIQTRRHSHKYTIRPDCESRPENTAKSVSCKKTLSKELKLRSLGSKTEDLVFKNEYIDSNEESKAVVHEYLFDNSNNCAYLVLNNALLRYIKTGANEYQYEKTVISFPNYDESISCAINSRGDLVILQKKKQLVFFISANNIKNRPEIKKLQKVKFNLEELRFLDDKDSWLPAYKESSIKNVDRLSYKLATKPLRFVDGLLKEGFSYLDPGNKQESIPNDMSHYYYQGNEGYCSIGALMNCLDHQGLAPNRPGVLEGILRDLNVHDSKREDFISKVKDLGFKLKMIRRARYNVTEKFVKLFNLENKNLALRTIKENDSRADLVEKLRYNASKIKNFLDKGYSIRLTVDAYRYYQFGHGNSHGLAVVGYSIKNGRMDLIIVDSNYGYMKLPLEIASAALNENIYSTALRKPSKYY